MAESFEADADEPTLDLVNDLNALQPDDWEDLRGILHVAVTAPRTFQTLEELTRAMNRLLQSESAATRLLFLLPKHSESFVGLTDQASHQVGRIRRVYGGFLEDVAALWSRSPRDWKFATIDMGLARNGDPLAEITLSLIDGSTASVETTPIGLVRLIRSLAAQGEPILEKLNPDQVEATIHVLQESVADLQALRDQLLKESPPSDSL